MEQCHRMLQTERDIKVNEDCYCTSVVGVVVGLML
jgi:hypothetical protein